MRFVSGNFLYFEIWLSFEWEFCEIMIIFFCIRLWPLSMLCAVDSERQAGFEVAPALFLEFAQEVRSRIRTKIAHYKDI